MLYLSKDEYEKRLKQYLKEQGSDQTPSWDWHVEKEREFQKILAESGLAKQK